MFGSATLGDMQKTILWSHYIMNMD